MISRLKKFYFYKNRLQEIIHQGRILQSEKIEFEHILKKHRAKTVFLHVGLSAVKQAFGPNPYQLLLNEIKKYFQNILVPGFTPSFRETSVYHKLFSQPEYGIFSKLFLRDSDYRTDDAIHSILVSGRYRFDGCDPQDSFGENSCFAQIDRDNVLYCNVGIPTLHSAGFHFLEKLHNVPYLKSTAHEGIIYYDERNFEKIIQKNHAYKFKVAWNRKKIEKLLVSEGALTSYNLRGLPIRFFRTQDSREILSKKLNKNPCYLIT